MEFHEKQEDTFSYTRRVTFIRRADGDSEYRVTIPKSLGDRVANGSEDVIAGRFILYVEDEDTPSGPGGKTLQLQLESVPYATHETYAKAHASRWEPLTCPFCGAEVARPQWSVASRPESDILKCHCGAEYYADLFGDEAITDWMD
ncbi:MAG: hypothetical protein DRH24_14245, partial [Deltaproteobacteria bacterium]